MDDSSLGIESSHIHSRSSIDSNSINLNDDLLTESSSVRLHKRSGSTASIIRNSIDDSFISSTTFQQDEDSSIYSPLGPNSIYELIIGSDIQRKKNRTSTNSITLFDQVINNINKPTIKEIPQIQLSKLQQKVSSQELEEKYYNPIFKEYKIFESSNALTSDVLQQLNHESKSIKEIPAVFLSSDFGLDDPRIFKNVLRSFTDDVDLSTSLNDSNLQEKLSNYLDIVEVNLVKEIESSSDSFFNAIDDIENVSNKSKEAVQLYQKILEKLNNLQDSATQGDKIIKKIQEFKNVEILEGSILKIQNIVETFKHAKSLFSSDLNSCIDEVLKVESIIDFQLPAFIQLQNDLTSLKNECAREFTEQFNQLLISDLRDYYQNTPLETTLRRLYTRKSPNTMYLNDDMKQKLQQLINNLIKSGNLVQAYTIFQNKFITEIKDIIKRNLPKSETDLSNNIKILTPKEFENIFMLTYAELSNCLRRLTIHQKILLDLALTDEIDIMSLDITKAIYKVIGLTQIRLMKVISVRSEQTADLSVPYYLRLYSITSCYLNECEMINPSFQGNVLGEWFNNHITYFIHRFHSNSIKEMTNEVLKETWKICEDKQELGSAQLVITELKQSSFSEYFNFYQPKEEQVIEVDQISIEEDSFLLPHLAVSILPIIRDYMIISKTFPNHASLNNILNFFKDLNLKTSQAVLGAGATKTAGLKHITTKHLALCIRFIEFIISVLNIINFDPSFSKIIQNFKDHESELFSKIINIMRDRTIIGCNKILSIDWSISGPHKYMEDLIKDTLTVSKVLTRYLPIIVYSYILSQIFGNYKKLFIETCLTKLPTFQNVVEKHNLLKDIDLFRVKLCDLPGYGNSGQVIWENINDLQTQEDKLMDEKMKLIENENNKPRLSFERLRNVYSRESTRSPKLESTEIFNSENASDILISDSVMVTDDSVDGTPVPESKDGKDVEVKGNVERLESKDGDSLSENGKNEEKSAVDSGVKAKETDKDADNEESKVENDKIESQDANKNEASESNKLESEVLQSELKENNKPPPQSSKSEIQKPIVESKVENDEDLQESIKVETTTELNKPESEDTTSKVKEDDESQPPAEEIKIEEAKPESKEEEKDNLQFESAEKDKELVSKPQEDNGVSTEQPVSDTTVPKSEVEEVSKSKEAENDQSQSRLEESTTPEPKSEPMGQEENELESKAEEESVGEPKIEQKIEQKEQKNEVSQPQVKDKQESKPVEQEENELKSKSEEKLTKQPSSESKPENEVQSFKSQPQEDDKPNSESTEQENINVKPEFTESEAKAPNSLNSKSEEPKITSTEPESIEEAASKPTNDQSTTNTVKQNNTEASNSTESTKNGESTSQNGKLQSIHNENTTTNNNSKKKKKKNNKKKNKK
ncbi:unnamed protein product [Candida verbasci]|uniref:Vacuolar protein sorting-associated protein 54 C-terminal domain-containing protein n=1 Tax=Candida verbasci TaxID=1227364 RepID=A0A9W4X8K7_9ASCO|nr:unnamed protein product [Candida verbasci]